jgi:hypothetical protein
MLALAIGTAVAFAPTLAPLSNGLHRSTVVMQETKDTMSEAIPFLPRPPNLPPPGTMAGDIGFDPLQITDLVPIQWSREAELKHARVCMLAWAGWVAVDLGFRVPFAPAVSSLYAHDACVEKGPMLGLFFFLAVIEIGAGIPKCFQILNDPDAAPGGDYKFDPLGFGGGRELEEKELANGRIAILGFSGTVTQAVLTGNGFPYTYNGIGDLIPPLTTTDLPLPTICGSGLAAGCM